MGWTVEVNSNTHKRVSRSGIREVLVVAVSIMKHTIVLFLLLPTVAAVGSVSGSSKVKESAAAYSCCGSLAFKFNPRCENTWTINDKPFVYSYVTQKVCISPCKKIEDELMTLETCLNINVTITCHDTDVTVEERIFYHSQKCSHRASNMMAPGNQGSVGLLLLAVMTGGWFVNHFL